MCELPQLDVSRLSRRKGNEKFLFASSLGSKKRHFFIPGPLLCMPAKKKPGDSFRLPHRRHEYFNFFVPQPLGVVPMCESGRNILAKHKKKQGLKPCLFIAEIIMNVTDITAFAL